MGMRVLLDNICMHDPFRMFGTGTPGAITITIPVLDLGIVLAIPIGACGGCPNIARSGNDALWSFGVAATRTLQRERLEKQMGLITRNFQVEVRLARVLSFVWGLQKFKCIDIIKKSAPSWLLPQVKGSLLYIYIYIYVRLSSDII